MIVENKNKWIIATPAKTGSYSLENTLIKDLFVAHKFEPNNRVGCEYDGNIKRRILIVRHPLERWSSMFWFARQKYDAGRSIFGATEAGRKSSVKAAQEYADLWLDCNKRGESGNFTYTFSTMAEQFGATEHAKTEDLQELINRLGYEANVRHSNKGKHDGHNWLTTAELLVKSQKSAILAIYKQDLKRYDYK